MTKNQTVELILNGKVILRKCITRRLTLKKILKRYVHDDYRIV